MPCIEAVPEPSNLAEKHPGRVAVVGVNNEVCFEKLCTDVYSKCGYEGIPCLITVVNNIVNYVRGPGEEFDKVLADSLEMEYAIAKEE
ncbi:hypothetical protein BGZ49_008513 [Haplosporangium sp. Z 27]|nr:hypothetical protein BGZ49_008513 [Haplosporangium sp. Z 27]